MHDDPATGVPPPVRDLTASQVAERVRAGTLSVVALVAELLDRIEALDPHLRAWVELDRDGALRAAAERDAEVRAGRVRGPLHGVPVAVKDIFHVAGMVTRAGAAPFAHERPSHDSAAVARLRDAGAVVLGKTATTEFAFFDPAETRNPWNLEHTPGGSSSGSAAAVAARMVPLALGSQTLGSTIRPAGYCGVVGFKPTYGAVSVEGVVPLAPSLDHVGIFVRDVADAAVAFGVLTGVDPGPLPAAGRPRLGLPGEVVGLADADVVAHLEHVADVLSAAGAVVEPVELPGSFAGVVEAGARLLQREAAGVHAERFGAHADEYGPKIRALIEAGTAMSETEAVAAGRRCRRFRHDIVPVAAAFDALLMPVAGTPAPKGLASTGDPTFCAPWTIAGLPALSLPSGRARDGLPLAVQLVSGDDRGLLAAAAWCERVLGGFGPPPLPPG